MIKPIGIAKRLNYMLKTPYVKSMKLSHVHLDGKPVLTDKVFAETRYEIFKDQQMFLRFERKDLGENSMTFWHYKIDKQGLVEDLSLGSKSITNRSGEIVYESNGTVKVTSNHNDFKETTSLKNLADDADLSALPPKEQIRIRNIKRFIKLIKMNPSYEKYDEAFSKVILGKST